MIIKDDIPYVKGRGCPDPIVKTVNHLHRTYTRKLGYIIVFEGIDGSGKSTQIQILYDYFRSRKKSVSIVKYNETRIIDVSLIRAYWYNSNPYSISFLLCSGLFDVINNKVIPDLLDGKIVIMDRYYYTIIARALAHGIKSSIFDNIFEFLPLPDKIFYLDLPVKDCERRKSLKTNRISFWEAGLLKYSKNRKKSFVIYQSLVRKNYLRILKGTNYVRIIIKEKEDKYGISNRIINELPKSII